MLITGDIGNAFVQAQQKKYGHVQEENLGIEKDVLLKLKRL